MANTAQVWARVEALVGPESGLSQARVEILRLCLQERTLVELMNAGGRCNRTMLRDSFMEPLLEEGLLVLTISDKPRSRLQRYRITEAGLAVLEDKVGGRISGQGGGDHA